MAAAGGFLKYVKKAFLVNWNLLIFGAATLAGVISGRPDVALPLIAAGEIVYLAGLSTHRRFQSSIDAAEHKAKQVNVELDVAKKKMAMLGELPRVDRVAFERLKGQCNELRAIAVRLRGEEAGSSDFTAGGINRLLWIYLKLLYSKSAIERFFQTINPDAIQAGIGEAEARRRELDPASEDLAVKRRRASLEDTIKTSQERLDNYKRAYDNLEFIKDEIQRLSAKIASLAEMSVNRQDPNFITSEVDSVATSVAHSEQAMSELTFLTGLQGHDDLAPELLDVNTTG